MTEYNIVKKFNFTPTDVRYKEIMSNIIVPFNKDYEAKILELALELYNIHGCFDMDQLYDSIETHNRKFLLRLKDEFLYDDDDGSFDDEFIDQLYQMFLNEDASQTIENMIFEATTKYHIPIEISEDAGWNYPIFITRYSKENSLLRDLMQDMILIVQAEHSQQLMFEDFFKGGSYKYGTKRILLMKEKENDLNGRVAEN